MVDLAGSEKQKKTKVVDQARKDEAIKINLSLSTLRKVIGDLVKGLTHIPYRDSKLTQLLQDSLGGNTKTFMVANIGPTDYNREETISTLKYAYGAKQIKNKPKLNQDPKDTLIAKYNDEISQLKMQLAQLNSGDNKIDPKMLAQIMGPMGGGDQQMAEIMIQREAEISQQREEIKKKREELKKMKDRAKEEGKVEVYDEEAERLEIELQKKKAVLDNEAEQKKKLVAELQKLEGQMVVGEKEKEKIDSAKHEWEKVKESIEKELEIEQKVEEIYKIEEKKKDQLEKKHKNLESQLSKIQRDIANKQ